MTSDFAMHEAIAAIARGDLFALEASLANDRRLAGPLRELLAACASVVAAEAKAEEEAERAGWWRYEAENAVRDLHAAGWPRTGLELDEVVRLFGLTDEDDA